MRVLAIHLDSTHLISYIDTKHLPFVGFLNCKGMFVAKKAPKTVANDGKPQKESLLKKRVSTPGKGKLGKTVKAPRWLGAIGGYFAGAWRELREVRWPTRRATWGLTLAVIIFTLVMTGFVLGLDFGFEQLFKGIIL